LNRYEDGYVTGGQDRLEKAPGKRKGVLSSRGGPTPSKKHNPSKEDGYVSGDSTAEDDEQEDYSVLISPEKTTDRIRSLRNSVSCRIAPRFQSVENSRLGCC
jgi:hypothetical protein